MSPLIFAHDVLYERSRMSTLSVFNQIIRSSHVIYILVGESI